jgi:hypothetical protein
MSTEQSFDRAGAVARYLELVPRVGPRLATAGAAAQFGVCTDAIRRAVVSTAVREHLHAVGLTHEPALSVVIAAAAKFRLTTDELQCAIDDHQLSMEAL